MADEKVKSAPQANTVGRGQNDERQEWESPRFLRLSARKAEVGLLLGPEVLVLLRS
jgi:hypothetical protein